MPKLAQVIIERGKPIRFEAAADAVEEATIAAGSLSSRLGETFKAYREASKQLFATRHQHDAEMIPPFLRGACNTTVFQCNDGILVRYDPAETDKPLVRVVSTDQSLEAVAPQLTEGVVHFPKNPESYVSDVVPPMVILAKTDASGKETGEGITIAPHVFGSVQWPSSLPYPSPPNRPAPLVSLTNQLYLDIGGSIEEPTLPGKREVRSAPTGFTIASTVTLPTGWCGIEVYPLLREEHWSPESAALWAAQDLLFALLQRNARDTALLKLDGRGATRKAYAALLAEFESILEGPEEAAHQFLKRNPALLCPTYDACWSKVPFGDKFSDFVIREAPNDYVLIEIEAPYRKLFRKNEHPRYELTHAIDQINDWLEFIGEHRAKVEQELQLPGISVSPRAMVVIGRARGLTERNRKKLVKMQERQPRLRIVTYDDVLAGARVAIERILGPLGLVVTGAAEVYYHPPQSVEDRCRTSR